MSGNSNPTIGIGIPGDYFLNKISGDLYGPKTVSGWGTPINLKGTANVVASTWMDWKPWNASSVSYIREVSYQIPAPIINAVGYSSLGNMLSDGGVLLVYITGESGWWQFPLPYFDRDGWKARWYARTGNYTNFYFNVSNPPGSSLPQAIIDLTDGRKIRYVLIPAGIQINTAKIGEKDFLDASTLQQLSYDQVKELFDLEN